MFLLLAIIIFSPSAVRADTKFISAKIGKCEYKLEVADSYLKIGRGLSGRKSLAEKAGMLFIFPSAGRHIFVMDGMNFPLDFIFLRNNRIVDLMGNVSPAGQKAIRLIPKAKIDRAIELNAGQIKKCRLKTGDFISFHRK